MNQIISQRSQSLIQHVYAAIEGPSIKDVMMVVKYQEVFPEFLKRKYSIGELWGMSTAQVKDIASSLEEALYLANEEGLLNIDTANSIEKGKNETRKK